ncbi:MAG: CHC2 zinc finger domain-containing protein [bacterium]|nr:CHC2 zinc finger domain-containing protein [bacterium]
MQDFTRESSTNQNSIPAHDWVATFPTVRKEYIISSLRAAEARITELESSILARLRKTESYKDGWFTREVIKAFEIDDLINLKREMRRLKRYLPSRPEPGRINEARINQAKEFSIVQIAEPFLQLKKSGKAYRSLCPFHNEKTPSLFLYPDSNTFHCFGCGKHSDVIGLTQQLHGMGFVDAVKYLTPSYES